MNNLFSKYKVFDIDASKLRSKNFYKDFIVNERAAFWKDRSALNIDPLESSCFLCGNSENNEVYLERDNYKLVQCSVCSLIYASVKVDKKYSELIYNNDSYEESTKK